MSSQSWDRREDDLPTRDQLRYSRPSPPVARDRSSDPHSHDRSEHIRYRSVLNDPAPSSRPHDPYLPSHPAPLFPPLYSQSELPQYRSSPEYNYSSRISNLDHASSFRRGPEHRPWESASERAFVVRRDMSGYLDDPPRFDSHHRHHHHHASYSRDRPELRNARISEERSPAVSSQSPIHDTVPDSTRDGDRYPQDYQRTDSPLSYHMRGPEVSGLHFQYDQTGNSRRNLHASRSYGYDTPSPNASVQHSYRSVAPESYVNDDRTRSLSRMPWERDYPSTARSFQVCSLSRHVI